jgi:hypothetical protein
VLAYVGDLSAREAFFRRARHAARHVGSPNDMPGVFPDTAKRAAMRGALPAISPEWR